MAWQQRSRRRTELPTDWATIRRQVLDRDQHRCTINGPRCLHTANHVDHTDHAAGPHDHRLEVLRAACQPCHMARTAQQGRDAQPSRHRPATPHPGLL